MDFKTCSFFIHEMNIEIHPWISKHVLFSSMKKPASLANRFCKENRSSSYTLYSIHFRETDTIQLSFLRKNQVVSPINNRSYLLVFKSNQILLTF